MGRGDHFVTVCYEQSPQLVAKKQAVLSGLAAALQTAATEPAAVEEIKDSDIPRRIRRQLQPLNDAALHPGLCNAAYFALVVDDRTLFTDMLRHPLT